jgi:hypothetical protein
MERRTAILGSPIGEDQQEAFWTELGGSATMRR